MDTTDVAAWFAAYLDDFARLGRGEVDDVGLILDHYGVPLVLSTDDGCTVLADEDDVLALARGQVEALTADAYDHSEVLAAETSVLNQTCATHHGRFVRRRADGSEISRLEATYLITDTTAGRRITAIAVHSPARA